MICPPNDGKMRQMGKGAIVKNEMPSMFLDEKLCFIRLPPDNITNFWACHYDYNSTLALTLSLK
jgi:hypothetical protein